MVLTEDDVLQPLDPTLASNEHSDSWPEFALRDVRIFGQSNRRLTSLFDAHPTQPVVVEGTLDKVAPDLRRLVHKPAAVARKTLRIRDVTMYSFSENEDGTLGFWAAGRAGWYELRTSTKSYAGIFAGMTEATGMFYYLADKYRNARPRPVREPIAQTKKLAVHTMFKYVESDYSQRRDRSDALEGFHEHRRFLIRCMLEEQEGLDWEGSAVFRYLKSQFSDDFKEMSKVVASNESAGMESEPDIMDVDEPQDPGKGHRNATMPLEAFSTPKQRRRAKRPSVSDASDVSEDDGTDSAEHTHGRSVLRPRGATSAKKYARRLEAKNPAASTTDAEADVEDGDDASEDDIDDQDSPSKQAFLSGLKGGNPTERVKAKPLSKTAKPADRAAYYENIEAGDIWTCPYDGCNERIYDARSVAATRLMEEHFSASHADNMTDLIKAEMRPYNRVEYLLSRVKDFAAAQSLMYDGAGGGGNSKDVGVVRRY